MEFWIVTLPAVHHHTRLMPPTQRHCAHNLPLMNDKLGKLLRRHNVVWVLPHQAWMPEPLEVVEKVDAVTGPFAYIRLLGDRKEVDDRTPTLNKIVVDRTEEMRRTAEAIRRTDPCGAYSPIGDGGSKNLTDKICGARAVSCG